MDEIKFETLNELYNRIYPAFNTKKNELKNKGIIAKEIDIWQFLKNTKWSLSSNLMIYDMVNDIMNLNEDEFKLYLERNNNGN